MTTRTETLPQDYTIAWTVAKLALASIVVTGIIAVFAASAYFQGTRPPQTPLRAIPFQR